MGEDAASTLPGRGRSTHMAAGASLQPPDPGVWHELSSTVGSFRHIVTMVLAKGAL